MSEEIKEEVTVAQTKAKSSTKEKTQAKEKAETLNLRQKLAKIRKMVEVVKKDKEGYGYKYVSAAELLASISAGLNEYGVSLTPRFVHGTENVSPYTYVKTKVTRDGKIYEENVNEILVSSEVVYTWSDDVTGESIDVPWVITGSQSDPSQALGGALSYSMRYFLINYFQVATLDDADPDAWRSKQREAAAAEDKMILTQIISEIDKTVREFIAANKDRVDEVKKFNSNYVASGNYKAISDQQLAAKMLKEFKEHFYGSKEDE